MAKTPREKMTIYNSTEPVSMDFDGSCFGVEYQPRSTQCQHCHDTTLCGIKYQEFVAKRVKKVEEEYLMLDKEIVPSMNDEYIMNLVKLIIDYDLEGAPLTVEEIMEGIGEVYHINNLDTQRIWATRIINQNNLNDKVISNGI